MLVIVLLTTFTLIFPSYALDPETYALTCTSCTIDDSGIHLPIEEDISITYVLRFQNLYELEAIFYPKSTDGDPPTRIFEAKFRTQLSLKSTPGPEPYPEPQPGYLSLKSTPGPEPYPEPQPGYQREWAEVYQTERSRMRAGVPTVDGESVTWTIHIKNVDASFDGGTLHVDYTTRGTDTRYIYRTLLVEGLATVYWILIGLAVVVVLVILIVVVLCWRGVIDYAAFRAKCYLCCSPCIKCTNKCKEKCCCCNEKVSQSTSSLVLIEKKQRKLTQIDPDKQLQIIQDLQISPLKDGDRIAEWEKEFRAAVEPVLTGGKSEDEVLSLLLLFVNRRPVERCMVNYALQEETLDDAFQVLRCLDDPEESYTCWKRGEVIDEYFINLLDQMEHTDRPISIACHHLIVQLPSVVQKEAILMFTDLQHKSGGISMSNAALLLSQIKELMSKEGVPLDVGCGTFKLRYNAPKASDQANDTGKAVGMIQGIAAIFFTFLDVTADLGLGCEYLFYGVGALKAMSSFKENFKGDILAQLERQIGLAGILNIVFSVLTFTWIAAGVVFQIVMFVLWKRWNDDGFRRLPTVVRLLMFIMCPILMSPVVIQVYLINQAYKGRDVTRFQSLLLTLKFGEVAFEALPQLATNWGAVWIKSWNYNGELGKPDFQNMMKQKGSEGESMTPFQLLSILTSMIGLLTCFMKWIITNRRHQFIGSKCKPACPMIPIFLWIFFTMLTATSGIMYIPTSAPARIIGDKAILVAAHGLSIVAFIVAIVYVAFSMQRRGRIVCGLLHLSCVIGSIVIAATTDVTNTKVYRKGKLFGVYRVAILAASVIQLITGFIVFLRPSACCGCCAAPEGNDCGGDGGEEEVLQIGYEDTEESDELGAEIKEHEEIDIKTDDVDVEDKLLAEENMC